MALTSRQFVLMQNAANQVCFTQTPHSTDIKTIVGHSDCGGNYPQPGPVNLFDGPESWVLETGWQDNGGGQFQCTDNTANRNLWKDLGSKVVQGQVYTVVFNIEALTGTSVRGRVKDQPGSQQGITGEYRALITAGSGPVSGAQSVLATCTISNLQLYEGNQT